MNSVTDPSWIEKFQTGLGAILGFVGVIVALLFNAWLERRRGTRLRNQEADALRVAFIEELKVSKYAYEAAIEKIEAAEADQTSSILVPTRCITAVYERMIDRLGFLASGEVEAVMNAYLMILQMPQSVSALTGLFGHPGEWVYVPLDHFADLKQLNRNMIPIVERAIAALTRHRCC